MALSWSSPSLLRSFSAAARVRATGYPGAPSKSGATPSPPSSALSSLSTVDERMAGRSTTWSNTVSAPSSRAARSPARTGFSPAGISTRNASGWRARTSASPPRTTPSGSHPALLKVELSHRRKLRPFSYSRFASSRVARITATRFIKASSMRMRLKRRGKLRSTHVGPTGVFKMPVRVPTGRPDRGGGALCAYGRRKLDSCKSMCAKGDGVHHFFAGLHHRVLENGAALQARAVSDSSVSADVRLRTHQHAASDARCAIDQRRRDDPLSGPPDVARLERRRSGKCARWDASREQGSLSCKVSGRGPHVAPVHVRPRGPNGEPCLDHPHIGPAVDVLRSLLRDEAEHGRRQDVYAAEVPGRKPRPPWSVPRDPPDPPVPIHLHCGVPFALGHRQQHHGGGCAGGPVRFDDRPQRRGEQDVAVDDDEVVVLDEPAEPADSSAGTLDGGLVDDREPEAGARAFGFGAHTHRVRKVVRVDSDLPDSRGPQHRQVVAQERLPEQWQGGVGPRVGERTQPGPEPRAEDDRSHRSSGTYLPTISRS